MPLNVRRFGAVGLSLLFTAAAVSAQTANPAPLSTAPAQTTPAVTAPPITNAPTAAEIMRDRIKKAKALVAVKNYNAAIYELEGIRKESSEPAVSSVVNVMLMNCYLEQSDYKRAQSLLNDIFNAKKQNRLGGDTYYAVAGQVVRGAKVQLERYKSLGLMVSDANLPADAVADVNKMRETVEIVITQSKTLGAVTKETPSAMALLEEATTARSGLARDDFDSKRWKEEVADARDGIVNSKPIVDASMSDTALPPNTTASANTDMPQTTAQTTPTAIIPIADKLSAAPKQTETTVAQATTPTSQPAIQKVQIDTSKSDETVKQTAVPTVTPDTTAEQSKSSGRARKVENQEMPSNTTATAETAAKNDLPISIGALNEYATAKVSPTYPPTAKAIRQTGTVRVDLIVDENGKPEIKNASGPGMLKQAATEAIKRWKFKPFLRDGQPVKATGYVSFNFDL